MEITLDYWNALAKQIILISSLLCGFSIAVVSNLLIYDRNDKLTNRILKSATLASASFLVAVFSMIQISMMTTPGGYLKNVVADDFALPRLMGTLSFLVGLFALTVVIALSGWTKSRKLGIYTTVISIVSLVMILITMM